MSTHAKRSSPPIVAQVHDGVLIVRMQDAVDVADLPELQRILTIDHGERGVVLSLEQATYLDSTVVYAVVDGAARLRRNRRELLLVAPRSPALLRLLDIVGASRRMRMFATVADALAALAEAGGEDSGV